MEGLSSSQLKSYLKNVKDLEVECYQLRKLSSELTSRMNNIAQQNKNLSTQNPHKYVKYGTGTYIKDAIKGVGSGIVLGAIFGCIVWIIVWGIGSWLTEVWGENIGQIIWDTIHGIFMLPITLFWMIFSLFTKTPISKFHLPFFPFIIIGIFGGIVICLRTFINGRKKDEKNLPTLQEYEHNKDKKIAINNKTVEALRLSQKICMEKHQETKSILEKYYALNYIYPKYRGLVPICMFYEYFDSGRCTALQGHEGAYNLYESELRMNMIIGKLDEIIYRLDEISSNQRILAQELRASNTKIEQIMRSMSSSLDSIQQSSAMTEYYSGITAANTSFMKWYTILNNKGAVLPL